MKQIGTIIGTMIVTFIMTIILVVLVNTHSEPSKLYIAKNNLIRECEKELPRNVYCDIEMKAVPQTKN